MMKQFFAATLALVALAGIVSPALAETVSTDDNLVVLSNYDNWLGKLSSYNAQNLIPVSQNVDNAQYTYYVKNAENLKTNLLLPLIESNTGADVTLRVQNPTAKAYFLNVPSQNVKVYVPVNSERTTLVDLNNVKAGETVSYYVTDLDGNTLAGGYVLNGSLALAAIDSADGAAYAQWGQALNQLIASNQYKAPVFEEKREVVRSYSQPASKSASKVVRGYW